MIYFMDIGKLVISVNYLNKIFYFMVSKMLPPSFFLSLFFIILSYVSATVSLSPFLLAPCLPSPLDNILFSHHLLFIAIKV